MNWLKRHRLEVRGNGPTIFSLFFFLLTFCTTLWLGVSIVETSHQQNTFTQADWTTMTAGATYVLPDPPTAGYATYDSKDAGVLDGADIRLQSASSGSALQTSHDGTGDTPNAGGFNAGTKTNVSISGTGTAAKAQLSGGAGVINGLVGVWHLNEAASGNVSTASGAILDASGNGYNGTFTNVNASVSPTTAYGPGKLNNAITFDGIDDRVSISSYTHSGSVISVSAWVYHNTLPSTIERYVTVGSEGAVIRHSGSGTLQFYVKTGGIVRTLVVGAALATGQWYHIVGTWDGTTQRLYKNGVQIASQVPGGTLDAISNENIFISWAAVGQAMDGRIDEVAVYNTALSAAEITTLYNSGTGVESEPYTKSPATFESATIDLTSNSQLDAFYFNSTVASQTNGSGTEIPAGTLGLVGLWRFNDASGQTAVSAAGSNNGTLGATSGSEASDPTWTTAANTKLGASGLSFDGVDDYVNVGAPPTTVLRNWTMEAWIYPNNLSQLGTVVSNGFEDANGGGGYSFGIGDGIGGAGAKLQGRLNGWIWRDSGYTFPAANRWYHVVMMCDVGTVRYYVNGEQTPTTDPNCPIYAPTTHLRIGSQSGIRFFNGRIDEVAIYDRVLSVEEIRSHYNSHRLQIASSNCSNGATNPPTCDTGTWNYVGHDGSASSYFIQPAGLWHLNEATSGNVSTASGTIVDASGNGSPGTFVNANASASPTTAYETSKLNGGIKFDGVDDYVDLGNPAHLQLRVGTYEAWIKTSNAGTGDRGIVVKQSGFGIYLNGNIFGVYPAGSGFLSTGVNLADGLWHHVAASFQHGVTNGTVVYIDGTPRLTTTWSTFNETYDPVFIGKTYGGGREFAGSIDEVAIYNRVLTPEEIKAHYNAGTGREVATGSLRISKPIGWWHFNESSGTTAAESSGNANTGTLTNMTTTSLAGNGAGTSGWNSDSAKLTNALKFDGTNDFVSMANVPTALTDNWTLEAWINPANLSQISMAVSNGSDDGVTGDGYAFGLGNGAGSAGNKLQGLLPGVVFIDSGYTFPTANQWYHVVMLRRSGTIHFYVNGKKTINTSTSAPLVPTQFRVGAQTGLRFFNGLIDEVAVYNKALTDSEIRARYNSGIGRENMSIVGPALGTGDTRYVRYKAYLGTADKLYTPQLDDLGLDYSASYPPSAVLTSSKFDAGAGNIFVKKLQWTEVLNGQDVKLQLATAASSGGLTTFCGPRDATTGSCTTSTYFTDPAGTELIDDVQIPGRWFQYKAFLTSNGSGTPTLDGVQVIYDTVSFQITGTGNATAGTAYPITVRAVDTLAASVTGYDGSKTLSFSGANNSPDGTTPKISIDNSCATAGDNYTFTSVPIFFASGQSTVYLCAYKAEAASISATAGAIVTSTSLAVTVNPAAMIVTVDQIVDPVVAGTPSDVRVTVKDAFGNAYTGLVSFTSNDSQAVLPANYTFIQADNGIKVFTGGVTMKTAGEKTVTATAGAVSGTQSAITVTAATVASLIVDQIADPLVVGVSSNVRVKAVDAFGNTVTGYVGTVRFSSDDPQATLPSNYTFQPADNGIKTFIGWITMKTVGERSVTAADTIDGTIKGTQNAITVTPASAANLILNAPADITVSTEAIYTVTRKDQFGNPLTSGAQTVYLSSDSTGNKQFRATPGGSAVTSVTIANGQGATTFFYYDDKAGIWTITASDATPPNGLTGLADATDALEVHAVYEAQINAVYNASNNSIDISSWLTRKGIFASEITNDPSAVISVNIYNSTGTQLNPTDLGTGKTVNSQGIFSGVSYNPAGGLDPSLAYIIKVTITYNSKPYPAVIHFVPPSVFTYEAKIGVVYNSTRDSIMANAWLERSGTTIADPGDLNFRILNSTGTALFTQPYDGYDSPTDVIFSNQLINGVYTNIEYDPSGGLSATEIYTVKADIIYRGKTFNAVVSFSKGALTALATDIATLQAGQATQTTSLASTISGQTTTLQSTISGQTTTLASQIGTIGTNVTALPTSVTSAITTAVTANINTQLTKGSQAELLTRPMNVAVGATVPIRFRTAPGLSPKITVYDPNGVTRVNAGPMREISNIGIYEHKLTFNPAWGSGDYTVTVTESTRGSTDSLVMSAGQGGLDEIYSKIASLSTDQTSSTGSFDQILNNVKLAQSNTTGIKSDITNLLSKLGKTSDSANAATLFGRVAAIDALSLPGVGGNRDEKILAGIKEIKDYMDSLDAKLGIRRDKATKAKDTILGHLTEMETLEKGFDSEAIKKLKAKATGLSKMTEEIRSQLTSGSIATVTAKLATLGEEMSSLENDLDVLPGVVGTASVNEAFEEVENVASSGGLEKLVPFLKELKEGREALNPENIGQMRNTIEELKSLMAEVRLLLDQEVNKPVIHGWLEEGIGE